MAVEEDRRLARRAQPLAVDDRVAGCLEDLRPRAPGAAETRLDPRRRALHLARARPVGRDRRDDEDLLELLQMAIAVLADVFGGGTHAFRASSRGRSF
jgi:hypothetical protein